jgi:hypothetical protein
LLNATAHRTEPGTSAVRGDYSLDVELPEGLEPRLGSGSLVVRLPTVRHNRVAARLMKSSAPGRLSLLLRGQVQDLNGRSLQVETPVEAQGLFTVDFSALTSPRGLGAKVFAVREGKAAGVEVQVLDLLDQGRALVAGALRPGEPVVVRGLDDLLEGDLVQVQSPAPREAL